MKTFRNVILIHVNQSKSNNTKISANHTIFMKEATQEVNLLHAHANEDIITESTGRICIAITPSNKNTSVMGENVQRRVKVTHTHTHTHLS